MNNALSNYTKQLIAFLSICSLGLWTGCHFSCENTQIVGPYFISAGDECENMAVLFNESEDYSGGGLIVLPTVFEIEWNNSFIVAKQHPKYDIEDIILNDYSLHAFDSLKKAGKTEGIHSISDSLSKLKLETNKQAGLFRSIKSQTIENITLYYLIDTREKSPYPTLFLSKQELDSALIKLNVGQLDKRKYYDFLDKR